MESGKILLVVLVMIALATLYQVHLIHCALTGGRPVFTPVPMAPPSAAILSFSSPALDIAPVANI